jgi:uncharacterized membrane protein
MQDSKRKSLLKAISWQTLGLFTTLGITWLFTGSLVQAGSMTFVMTGVAFITYFLHERVWARVEQ